MATLEGQNLNPGPLNLPSVAKTWSGFLRMGLGETHLRFWSWLVRGLAAVEWRKGNKLIGISVPQDLNKLQTSQTVLSAEMGLVRHLSIVEGKYGEKALWDSSVLCFRVQSSLVQSDVWGHWILLPASFTAFHRTQSCLAAYRQQLSRAQRYTMMCLGGWKREERCKGLVQLRVLNKNVFHIQYMNLECINTEKSRCGWFSEMGHRYTGM